MPSFSFIPVQQKEHSFKLASIPAGLLTRIAYAAVRRKDEEQGAAQRILNTSRITGIKDFALRMGDFPASIVLNWVGGTMIQKNETVDIPDQPRIAQIIDGQHRVAGLKAAIQDDTAVADYQIPVAIYEGLDTAHSARIFISVGSRMIPH